MEKQQEKIRVCPDCSGVLRIDTTAGTSSRVTAIQIPRKACDKCIACGHRWYESADEHTCERVYLQDRVADKFQEKKLRPGIGERF